jgi:hypothetical protein
MCVAEWVRSDGRRGSYGGYGEEHDDQLFLAEDWVLNEGIGEADEASAAFLQEGG